ncbi:MAG: DNA-invertase hin [Mycoplasmataceae bacterium]|nr:MAG: DNA-invertase hin [Mycoplasmataceae bacterium]
MLTRTALLSANSKKVFISSSRTLAERKILAIFHYLQAGDTLIISELSRLGRSTMEVLSLVNQFVDKGITLIIIKENLQLNKNNLDNITNDVLLTVFAMLGKLEKSLIKQRTKEALANKKASGFILGKPKGKIQRSIYDNKLEIIKERLSKKMNIPNISKWIGLGTQRGLFDYI